MAVARVRQKGQITIPTEVRAAARIEEGAMIEFTVTDKGVLMRPKVLIDAEDAWFHSPAWQERHREAIAELDRGEGEFHESTDDFLRALDQG